LASITIRQLDERLSRLRVRAAEQGRSMEEEARDILRAALNQEAVSPTKLGTALHELFRPYGGVDLGCGVEIVDPWETSH
jgi:plasmid stability protein